MQSSSCRAAGILIGLPAAAATRALSAQLFEVAPIDPAVFAIVAFFLISVAAAAIYIPARRASRVDPASVLRNA